MKPDAQFAHIGAVVLAAGQSRRMGTPKLVLPWGNTTVIGNVTGVLQSAGLGQIVVVTGAHHALIDSALQSSALTRVHNPQYEQSEMLASLQIGLRALLGAITACLVILGDQPQIDPDVVAQVLERADDRQDALIVPSYHKRRGHPWLVGRALWDAIFALRDPEQTLRDFLHAHASQIEYITVETPAVLMDLDTPEEYRSQRPEGSA